MGQRQFKVGESFFHIVAIFAVAVWGATFVSSKTAIDNGLSPTELFIYRFLIAYVVMWFFSPRKLFANSWKDELKMMVVGLTGGSVYFIFENTALALGTDTSSVSLLVATAPIWTAVLTKIVYPKTSMGANMWVGTVVALVGCALIIFNGKFELSIGNPVGFLLSLAAAVSWAVYGLTVKSLSAKYDPNFITRKVFFWGVVTAVPFMYIPATGFNPMTGTVGVFNFQALAMPAVWGNVLFLGLIASMACYALWNVVINKLGMVKSSNYLYLSPAFTMVASMIFLDSRITWVATGGFVLIVGGLILAEKGFTLGLRLRGAGKK